VTPPFPIALLLGFDEGAYVFIVPGAVFLFWLLLSFLHKITRTVARERTRREIAAYIAEGSMSPEQGEKLMKAGERPEF
jgi:hypothetical protein